MAQTEAQKRASKSWGQLPESKAKAKIRRNLPEVIARQAKADKIYGQTPKGILSYIKTRAKRRGLTFNLTLEDIVIPTHCCVLGTLLIKTPRRGYLPDAPTIDRIDISKGYIKGNVRIISWRANKLKSDGTLQEFEAIITYMKKHS